MSDRCDRSVARRRQLARIPSLEQQARATCLEERGLWLPRRWCVRLRSTFPRVACPRGGPCCWTSARRQCLVKGRRWLWKRRKAQISDASAEVEFARLLGRELLPAKLLCCGALRTLPLRRKAWTPCRQRSVSLLLTPGQVRVSLPVHPRWPRTPVKRSGSDPWLGAGR